MSPVAGHLMVHIGGAEFSDSTERLAQIVGDLPYIPTPLRQEINNFLGDPLSYFDSYTRRVPPAKITVELTPNSKFHGLMKAITNFRDDPLTQCLMELSSRCGRKGDSQ
ncbi:MAG: hypothetical protein LLG45_08385 [Actinomycetia bacterium]|nr:hypothetical protein [Actinomycetes bacterium]